MSSVSSAALLASSSLSCALCKKLRELMYRYLYLCCACVPYLNSASRRIARMKRLSLRAAYFSRNAARCIFSRPGSRIGGLGAAVSVGFFPRRKFRKFPFQPSRFLFSHPACLLFEILGQVLGNLSWTVDFPFFVCSNTSLVFDRWNTRILIPRYNNTAGAFYSHQLPSRDV